MFALPCATFNTLDLSNAWDHLDKPLINSSYVQNQENFQDAKEQDNLMLAGDHEPIDDLPEDVNPEDNVLVNEEEDPMNYDEALEFQGLRKRSRNQLDSDDEMNNGSNSVNGLVI